MKRDIIFVTLLGIAVALFVIGDASAVPHRLGAPPAPGAAMKTDHEAAAPDARPAPVTAVALQVNAVALSREVSAAW